MSATGRVPLPCHGQQPDHRCSWCRLGIERHPPSEVELEAVATLYNPRGVRLARTNGVHPSIAKISALV